MNKYTVYNKKQYSISNTLANSIRRVLINEIQTYTFDNIVFNNFKSSIYNIDYIIQRLRLIPLIQSKVRLYKDNKFQCKVVNNSDKFIPVTPKDITTNGNHIDFIDSKIYNNLPIIYLPPHEEIDFTCNVVKNNETGYNKYCHCWYDDDNLYIESINKTDGKEIQTAIQYLIYQCQEIRTKISAKYFNIAQNNFKIDIKLEDISRSAINIIVDYSRLIISAIIKQIKQEEITPSDFIISIVQPHLSENKYSILFDINDKYLLKPNDDPTKPNVVGYFKGYLINNKIKLDKYNNSNTAVFIILGCIECTINYLWNYYNIFNKI